MDQSGLAADFAQTPVPDSFSRAAWALGYKFNGNDAVARTNKTGEFLQTDWTKTSFMLKNTKVLLAGPGYNNNTALASLTLEIPEEEANRLLGWGKALVKIFWDFTEKGKSLATHKAKKPATKWRKAVVENFADVHSTEESASAMLEFLADKHAMDHPGKSVPEGADLIWKYRNNPGFMEGNTNILLAQRVKSYNEKWELSLTCDSDVEITLPTRDASGKVKATKTPAGDIRRGDTFAQIFLRMNIGTTQQGGPSFNFMLVHKKAGARPILKAERGDKPRSEETPEDRQAREKREAAKKQRQEEAAKELEEQQLLAALGEQ